MQYTKSQFLMGTDVIITVNETEKNPIEDIYNSFGIFYSFEKEFSRFLEDSELIILNKLREKEMSNRFVEILNLSIDVYKKTNNYFNPLVNVSNIGYSSDFGRAEFIKYNNLVNLDLEKMSIIGNFVSLKENQYLDFGGIVKGYAVDKVNEFLQNKGYKNFIINAGGDIYISGNNKLGKIPIVAIDSPFNIDNVFATLELKDKSISTSGTYKRKWDIENKKYHHILNPLSNENNDEIISITIIHDKCYLSDAYATACIAMGIEKTLQFLQEKNIDGVIIGSDGKVFKTEGMEKYQFEKTND